MEVLRPMLPDPVSETGTCNAQEFVRERLELALPTILTHSSVPFFARAISLNLYLIHSLR